LLIPISHSTAQGIVAQARVLGGSFGIAASTAILRVIEARELRSVLSPSQLAALDLSTLNTAQSHAVRQAYAHAFNHTLRISTVLSGISILFALLSYQKNPPTLAERSQQQVAAETARQIAIRRRALGTSVPPPHPLAKEESAHSSKASDIS